METIENLTNELVAVIESPTTRKLVREKARDKVFAVTGSRSNACAAMAGECLIKAGILNESDRRLLTRDLDRKLKEKFPTLIRIDDPSKLKAGDIAFSLDKNQIPGPDHVFIIATNWTNEHGDRQIVDNTSDDYVIRNMTHGHNLLWKTPFAYAYRLPNKDSVNDPAVDRNKYELKLAAYKLVALLYDLTMTEHLDVFDQDFLARLHNLRQSTVFDGLNRSLFDLDNIEVEAGA